MSHINRHVLKPHETALTYLWMKENKERLERDRVTQAECAAQAEKALNFKVTDGNVVGIGKGLGVKWGNLKGPNASLAACEASLAETRQLVEGLHATVRRLEADVDCLRGGVSSLFEQFGVKPPAHSGLIVQNGKCIKIATNPANAK